MATGKKGKRGKRVATAAPTLATPATWDRSAAMKKAWERRRRNGTDTRGNGRSHARGAGLGVLAAPPSGTRLSFGDELKAFSDITTILEKLPAGSRNVVLEYLASKD